VAEQPALGSSSIAPVIHIGTQSWFYPDWKGVFYDRDAEQAEFLRMYAEEFRSVEVDTTFYGIPTEATLQKWLRNTPDDFSFACKAPRAITHEKRFFQAEKDFDLLCERLSLLGPKLGPILFQLPPDCNASIAPYIFHLLERRPPHLKCAFEFRHVSWFTKELVESFDERDLGIAAVDGPFIPLRYAQRLIERPTATFHYLRILGVRGAVEEFDHLVFDRMNDLADWARRIAEKPLAEAWITTSNYYEGFAVDTARRFAQACGITVQKRSLHRPSLFDISE
jgi:uncharacterized protein YecE (DUF72 family)